MESTLPPTCVTQSLHPLSLQSGVCCATATSYFSCTMSNGKANILVVVEVVEPPKLFRLAGTRYHKKIVVVLQ